MARPFTDRMARNKYSQKWREGRIARGLCACCGKEPLISTIYGVNCLRSMRKTMRKKLGIKKKTWLGRQGRVPLELQCIVKDCSRAALVGNFHMCETCGNASHHTLKPNYLAMLKVEIVEKQPKFSGRRRRN